MLEQDAGNGDDESSEAREGLPRLARAREEEEPGGDDEE